MAGAEGISESERYVARYSLVEYTDAVTGQPLPPRFLGFVKVTISEQADAPVSVDEAAKQGTDVEDYLEG